MDANSDNANIDPQDNTSTGSATSREQGCGNVVVNILDKIDIIPGLNKDMRNVTFVLKDEDHTLGNTLRYVIMKNPHVDYCGYSIPHPSEAKLNLRVQTSEKTDAVEALKKGLEDLAGLCLYVESEFKKKIQESGFDYDPDSL
ncbi:11665_t:CDS:2 [Ambispora gerdemannii]|uniref:DNA-directed RNA polymerases I and III subunit RPAC2 n=1 Tax=Ambispora gerdemannii TaxID=144530 RepID=A0A9N8W2T0_9GLOM|nr:11665_t:CDS:2 [Ambispora gerdemannii]